jgi:hypothetical protein
MVADPPKSHQEEPEAPVFDLQEVVADAGREAAIDHLWATRGKAVQAYALLEQALCRVLALVSGTSPQVAAIIFFRIASTQARNDILDKLIRLQFRREFSLFWNSVFRALRPTDIKRNEIVHWSVSTQVRLSPEGPSSPEVTLRPPTFWSTLDESAPQITNDDLQEFMKKCHFYSQHINVFAALKGAPDSIYHLSADEAQTWLDIFHKPLVYPPPTDIPQSPTPAIRGTPPQSSPP